MQKGRSTYLIFSQRHLGVILLFTMCVIALFSFDEYGIGWDELRQRETGMINWRYIFSDDPGLLTYQDRDYGVAFELPLVMIEKTFNLTDTRDVYLMRHLVTHLFFLLGAFFCFKLVDFLYQNKLLATVAFLLIVLHPRLYAHSFFNSKDIPFMSMFVICLYFNAIAFRKKTVNHFIVLGISIGLLINLRIMGALLPCCIFLFLIVDAAKEKEYMHHLKLGLILLGTSAVVLYTTWPFYGPPPLNTLDKRLRTCLIFAGIIRYC
ncbi:MAG: glycosyltransferase family 39 protein [Flavobacteriales bacterium]|nr:glycosyltransferase family 39 protein [Flavobacteriales bacterium]